MQFLKNELIDLKNGISGLYHGNKRTFLLFLILGFLVITLDMFQVIKVSMVIPLFAATVAHTLRKILFPYLDTREFIKIIKDSEGHSTGQYIASAMVVCGVLAFTAFLILIFGFKVF